MKVLCKNDKYAQLSWAETSYCGELTQVEDAVKQLLEQYPDLDVICCTGSDALLACAKIVESLGASVKVTGLGLPYQMKDYVGEDKACPYFFLWNPYEIGSCAAYALEALVGGATLEEGGSLTTKLGTYKVFSGLPSEFTIMTGPPFCFTPEVLANDANVY
jgi:rhamnose transport system substrate-binding protein